MIRNGTYILRLGRNLLCLLSAVLVCILLAWLFSGCRTRTMYLPSETVIQTRYVERIDTVQVEVAVPDQAASNVTPWGPSHLETDVAQSDAWVDSAGMLHHNLANKPVKLPAQIPVKSAEKDSVVFRDRPVPYPVERELSRWERVKIDFGGFALGAVAAVLCAAVVWLARKFRK